MKYRPTHCIGKIFCALSAACLLAGSSAWATVVTWNLNPSGSNGAAGSNSQSFSSSGYNVTAYGYTVGSPNTPLGLYFKNQGSDQTGLGIVGPANHELQGNGSLPQQFMQLDVSSILAQGFSNGKIEVGSVGYNDKFVIWGSSTLGDPGHQIGGTYNSSSDMVFISISDFSDYNYISIGALSGGVLPAAFRASLTAVPEVGALFPILGLIIAVSLTQFLRRRRMAQSRGGSR